MKRDKDLDSQQRRRLVILHQGTPSDEGGPPAPGLGLTDQLGVLLTDQNGNVLTDQTGD